MSQLDADSALAYWMESLVHGLSAVASTFRGWVLGHLEPHGWHAVGISVQVTLAEPLPLWVCSGHCIQALRLEF